MIETLFMIHGMWAGPSYWGNYKSLFEEKGHNCITTTLRFHDMNPKDVPDPRLGTTSLLDYIEDLEQEIQDLDMKPIVIGHSMGGLLAQILGSRGLAKAFVLLTPASPSGMMALTPSVIKSFWRLQAKMGFWKKPMRPRFNDAAYSMLQLLPPGEQREVYNTFVYESGRAAAEIGYWFFDPNHASKVDESKVRCPVLVIAGGKDRITPASLVRQVAMKYKSVSSYKAFGNHAHWVVAESGWQEIAEYVTDWLGRALMKNV